MQSSLSLARCQFSWSFLARSFFSLSSYVFLSLLSFIAASRRNIRFHTCRVSRACACCFVWCFICLIVTRKHMQPNTKAHTWALKKKTKQSWKFGRQPFTQMVLYLSQYSKTKWIEIEKFWYVVSLTQTLIFLCILNAPVPHFTSGSTQLLSVIWRTRHCVVHTTSNTDSMPFVLWFDVHNQCIQNLERQNSNFSLSFSFAVMRMCLHFSCDVCLCFWISFVCWYYFSISLKNGVVYGLVIMFQNLFKN